MIPFHPSSAYYGYAYQLCKKLSADCHLIAWSGRGLYMNNIGTKDDVMPDLWRQALATRKNTVWDHLSWLPAAVVVNLGQNDWRPTNTFTAATWESAMVDFLTSIRQVYGTSMRLFVACGPMDYLDGGPTAYCPSVARVVEQLDAEGWRIYFMDLRMEFPMQGCTRHPNFEDAEIVATHVRAPPPRVPRVVG